ncbi:hypothetical protein HDV03_004696 [Kappamyces sp. JEL0829]|nr:hypothetical protein HDV03_004696 [Kappamyces sp. JEL0829]
MHRNHEEANESIATLRAKALVTLRNKLRKPSTPDAGQTLSDAPSPLANEANGISTLPSARLPGAVASKASSPRSSKRKLSNGADEPSLAHVQGTEIPPVSAVVNGTRPEEAMVSDAVSGKSSNPALADLSHPYYVPLQILAQSGIFAHLLHTLSLPGSEQFSHLLLNQDVLHLVREQLCLLISQGISWTQIEHMGLARICIAHFAPEILGSGDGLAPMAIDTTGPKVRVVQDLPALAAKHKKRKKSKKGAADQTEVPALQSPTVDLEERSDGQLDGSAATVELSDSLQTMPSDLSLAPARDPFALVIDCSDSSSDDGSVELRINAAAPQDIELDIKLQHHAALESELAHASTSLYLDQSLSHSLGIRIKQDEEKKLALEREAVFLEQRSLVAMERAVKLDGIKKECQGHILKLANQIAELEKQRLELEKSRGMFVEKLKGFEADLEQAIKGRESDTAKLAEIKRKQDMLDSGLAKSRAELSEFEQAFIAKKTFVEEKSVILDSMSRSGIFTPVSLLHRMHDSSFAVSTTVHLEFFSEYTPGFQQVVSDIVDFAELFPASSPRPWCVWKPRIVSYERARLRNASLCAMDLERAGSCTTLNCQFSHGKQLDASDDELLLEFLIHTIQTCDDVDRTRIKSTLSLAKSSNQFFDVALSDPAMETKLLQILIPTADAPDKQASTYIPLNASLRLQTQGDSRANSSAADFEVYVTTRGSDPGFWLEYALASIAGSSADRFEQSLLVCKQGLERHPDSEALHSLFLEISILDSGAEDRIWSELFEDALTKCPNSLHIRRLWLLVEQNPELRRQIIQELLRLFVGLAPSAPNRSAGVLSVILQLFSMDGHSSFRQIKDWAFSILNGSSSPVFGCAAESLREAMLPSHYAFFALSFAVYLKTRSLPDELFCSPPFTMIPKSRLFLIPWRTLDTQRENLECDMVLESAITFLQLQTAETAVLVPLLRNRIEFLQCCLHIPPPKLMLLLDSYQSHFAPRPVCEIIDLKTRCLAQGGSPQRALLLTRQSIEELLGTNVAGLAGLLNTGLRLSLSADSTHGAYSWLQSCSEFRALSQAAAPLELQSVYARLHEIMAAAEQTLPKWANESIQNAVSQAADGIHDSLGRFVLDQQLLYVEVERVRRHSDGSLGNLPALVIQTMARLETKELDPLAYDEELSLGRLETPATFDFDLDYFVGSISDAIHPLALRNLVLQVLEAFPLYVPPTRY